MIQANGHNTEQSNHDQSSSGSLFILILFECKVKLIVVI